MYLALHVAVSGVTGTANEEADFEGIKVLDTILEMIHNACKQNKLLEKSKTLKKSMRARRVRVRCEFRLQGALAAYQYGEGAPHTKEYAYTDMIVPDDKYCTHPSLQQGDAGDDGTSTADIVQLLSKVKESGKADKDAANFIKKHDVALYVALQVCQCTMPRQCGVACAVQMPPPLSTRTHRR